jgi:putative addiction module component (TIGR02574 family)
MNSQLKTLADEALKLSPDEREALVQVLIASVDAEDDLEAAWAVEVERRNTDLDAGMAHPIPLAEALAQLRSTLK